MSNKALLAKVVVIDIPEMSSYERNQVADWLEVQAEEIRSSDPQSFEDKFTPRLFKE